MDDRELIGRVLAGDARAERELYDAHVDRVFRLVYRMAGDTHRAQDYTQETFIRAFRRLADFRGESALSTWLCAIAVSVTLNGLRSLKRAREREVGLDEAPAVGARPVEAEPDLKIRMRRAIDGLPEGYRTVFVMHDVEGYTHEEIASTLGVQPGTSKAQTFKMQGIVRVFCQIHPTMSAIIAVVPSPWYATTLASGKFTIPNVPAGEYQIQFFHERSLPDRLQFLAKTITVPEEGVTLPLVTGLPGQPAQRKRFSLPSQCGQQGGWHRMPGCRGRLLGPVGDLPSSRRRGS